MEHRTRADVSCTGVVVVCPCGYRAHHQDRETARVDQVRHESLYTTRRRDTPAYAAARRATARANAAQLVG
jgi:hypothetical protein